ncbi:MAG: class I SAM-dependent methyltransferase [Planctomycetia bacterium]|nr:class I SAM-dependent methyltransferase [Planctomycetia bacterium]
MSSTREPQYQDSIGMREQFGATNLGMVIALSWHEDPKRLAFTFARYKFVAKMFAGMERVLEVGCGDGFASRIVKQEVTHLTAVDFDPIFIRDAQERMRPEWAFDCKVHDMLEGPVSPGNFEGIYSLDVLEHIQPKDEDAFVGNAVNSLADHGSLIIGMPSLESQAYASPRSKAGHVNCKSAPDLKKLMQRFFHRVFMFSMNDEVVHTGFHPMAQYVIALCCDRK